MKIQKLSIFSGQTNEMDLDVTTEQLARWEAGELIQNVFPHLTADEREFLITGITKEEWDKEFGDDRFEDEDEDEDE